MTGDLILLGFCAVVGVFVLVAFARLMVILGEDAEHQKAIDQWFAERLRFREESSLADDVNSGLPESFKAPGIVVEFKEKARG